jgi:selenocysteine-specific elongation factor
MNGAPVGVVVGTAGHIDHGKSSLIRALTGIDPDRLEEEKRRGMTIDLGFAHLRLSGGRVVGIVDVPGHARFVRNMLAGVHGLDAVLLVVAADEGVMPQTVEHLEIVDLMEVRRGLAVLTKVDLVEPDWLELVREEVAETLARTSLAGAEILPVSTVTGQGLDDVARALERLLDEIPARVDLGRPRLPIDRVFTIAGFGTVVTGTLIEGELAVGEEVELQPSGRRTRIRGLQQHGQKVDRAAPGSRVAANLVGIEKDELGRGEVLARPGTLAVTRRVDASVRVLPDSPHPLRHDATVMLHTGTAEVPARVIVLGGETTIPAGQTGWAQLYLARPVAVRSGDRFVLRLPSPAATVAGGVLADVAPRRHRRHDPSVRASLERRSAGAILSEELRKYPRGITAAGLVRATLADAASLSELEARRAGEWLFAPEAWAALADRARRLLEEHHRAHPLRAGMPRGELQSRLGLAPAAFGPVLAALAEEGVLVERGGEVARPDHRVEIDIAAPGPAARLLEVLGRQPFAPPSLPEAMREAGASPEVVRALVASGALVRLSDEVVFTEGAYRAALELVRELAGRDGFVTVAGLRDRMGASRRPVLALLEHLDARRVTRRVGDQRVLLR